MTKEQIFKQYKITVKPRFTTIIILCLLLFFTSIAVADFKPTNRKPASDYSRSGGRRGCETESIATIPLTLLAPQTYVGYTASLRPTFTGYVSSPQKVELRIFELIANEDPKPIGNEVLADVKAGIFQINYPDKYPNLTVGKTYLWQLSRTCLEVKIDESAEFIVAEIPSTIKNKLLTTNNKLEKANLYAEEGFWYEAVTEALQLTNNLKLGKLGTNLVKDFAKYESARDQREEVAVKERVKYLQQIAIQEQD
ncbi:DUF928 domain-containing protein [Nostoc sp. MS1]|uniref:DUF928 domain-containing protein n=1 Tax=Nostoc sp. MS1 TaxID=2764711 RepID=UPI001CC75DA8|nr:DUF928 domain-containing protein [Nostoc sp. MS1]BCL39516.1 hypothetical protein NSMS1_59630 [Nostoc sp. MS1]